MMFLPILFPMLAAGGSGSSAKSAPRLMLGMATFLGIFLFGGTSLASFAFNGPLGVWLGPVAFLVVIWVAMFGRLAVFFLDQSTTTKGVMTVIAVVGYCLSFLIAFSSLTAPIILLTLLNR